MKHRWAALVAVLALSALAVGSAQAQSSGAPPPGRQRGAGPLKQNYPNPFNPETTIPFSVGMEGDPEVCTSPGKKYTVSLRIYNVLPQLVAIPVLQGGGEQAGTPLNNVQLTCGSEYSAFWDGLDMNTKLPVPSMVYIARLEIDGKAYTIKMFVTK